MIKNKIIFMSVLDIWSMKEGIGAPSFYNTLKLYIEKGDDVVLIKPSGRFHSEYNLTGLKTITFNNDFFDSLTSIKIISFFGRILSQWYRTYKFYTIAKKELLSSNEKCILYAYEVNAVKAASLLSKKYVIPFITRFQGTVLYNQKDNLYNRLRLYPQFEALSQKSDLVIMTNDGTFGETVLHRLGNNSERIMFWRNGVEFRVKQSIDLQLERYKQRKIWGITNDSFVFMTLSRLANWKRIDRAIRAFSAVVKNHPNCNLVIVGEGDMRDTLLALAIRCGVEDKVVFAGSVAQSETWKCFNAIDTFLSLYDLGNLGNPLYEALYCGKPIITLNNGDTASVIKNEYNALMLPPEDESLIQKAMSRVICDGELRDKLSKNAREYASKNLWTWSERMDSEYKVVTEVINDFYGK